MIEHIPPAIILILGALLIPLFRGPLKAGYMLLLPVLSIAWMLAPLDCVSLKSILKRRPAKQMLDPGAILL